MSMATGGLVVMSSVIACVVGAGVAFVVVDNAATAERPLHGGLTPPSQAMTERLEEQAREIERLQAELAEMKRRLAGGGASRTPTGTSESVTDNGYGTDPGGPDGTMEVPEGDSGDLPEDVRKLQSDLQRKANEEARRLRDGGHLEEQLKARVKQINVSPALTDEQVDAVAKILMDRNRKLTEITQAIKPEGTAEERFGESQKLVEEMRRETKGALEGVLNPQQVDAVLLALGARRPGPVPGGDGGGAKPGGGQRRPGNGQGNGGGQRPGPKAPR